MTFFQEYALLIGVATPVLVVVAIQACLYFMGERGTLLLPSMGRYPSVDISEVAIACEPLEVTAIERDGRLHAIISGCRTGSRSIR